MRKELDCESIEYQSKMPPIIQTFFFLLIMQLGAEKALPLNPDYNNIKRINTYFSQKIDDNHF